MESKIIKNENVHFGNGARQVRATENTNTEMLGF